MTVYVLYVHLKLLPAPFLRVSLTCATSSSSDLQHPRGRHHHHHHRRLSRTFSVTVFPLVIPSLLCPLLLTKRPLLLLLLSPSSSSFSAPLIAQATKRRLRLLVPCHTRVGSGCKQRADDFQLTTNVTTTSVLTVLTTMRNLRLLTLFFLRFFLLLLPC